LLLTTKWYAAAAPSHSAWPSRADRIRPNDSLPAAQMVRNALREPEPACIPQCRSHEGASPPLGGSNPPPDQFRSAPDRRLFGAPSFLPRQPRPSNLLGGLRRRSEPRTMRGFLLWAPDCTIGRQGRPGRSGGSTAHCARS
jgi:hypothetical protein